MKLKDLKPGMVYAYQRSDNYEIQPMMFLSADLYHERSSNVRAGPYFRPVKKPYCKWDKPRKGTWGNGSVGYPVAFIDLLRGTYTEHQMQLLLSASLDEMVKLAHWNPPGRDVVCAAPECGWVLGKTDTSGQYMHEAREEGWSHFPVLPTDMYAIDLANERHATIRYSLLTNLSTARGDWTKVRSERELEKIERDKLAAAVQHDRDILRERTVTAANTITKFGIKGVEPHPYKAGEVWTTLEALEALAEVVTWAKSRGLRADS